MKDPGIVKDTAKIRCWKTPCFAELAMVRPVSQLWSLWDDRRIEGEIASDDDEQQVRRQVRHLLKVDEEYPVNIIADEDAQRAFRDINLSHVSASCMKIVVNLICASIQQANNTPMSYLDTKLMQGGEVVFRGACQRRGTPGFLEHSRKGTKTPSKKCNCHFFSRYIQTHTAH